MPGLSSPVSAPLPGLTLTPRYNEMARLGWTRNRSLAAGHAVLFGYIVTARHMDGTVLKSFTFLPLPLLLSVLAGCAGSRQEIAYQCRASNYRGIVFAVDGAGGFEATSAALRNVIDQAGMPLRVESVYWSHGYGRFFADQMDWAHARVEGSRLAAQVANWRAANPTCDVYLLGHSAGSAVVLAAGEALPADHVKRIVLLAPSVSTDYDIRPALRSASDGVDVFFSQRDVFYLGFGVAVVGTVDRWFSPAAGRTGFRPTLQSNDDIVLYQRLHQHPWHPSVEWTGNYGGHYDAYQPAYLRSYVLPLFN
jgi:pimeloyl-ACP methyl ester carboxylesterase